MQTIRVTIEPKSHFATLIQGDTFFGQLCWAVRYLLGEEKLKTLLSNYSQKPFVVVSDAFPAGYLPKPHLPQDLLGTASLDPKQRKEFKRKQWIPLEQSNLPVNAWMQHALTDKELLKKANNTLAHTMVDSHQRMHNSINRLTGTTGEGGFAPYSVQTFWMAEGITWDMYFVFDEIQITEQELQNAIEYIGTVGYGKDASIGAGKFAVIQSEQANLPHHDDANAYLTLSASAPQGLEVKPEACFYQPFTRFGRHGDWAVLVNPFKAPILLAKTASVFTPQTMQKHEYWGAALGGQGEISRTLLETVHQAYAPVLRICLDI